MKRVFLKDGALQYLLNTDLGTADCPRGDYLIDDVDTPVFFEVTAGDRTYSIESWIRDNSDAKMMSYGKKIELAYGESINADEDGPAGTQRAFAGVARQLDRYFDKIGFWKNNTAPEVSDGGVLLSLVNEEPVAKIVTGEERPDMKCAMAGPLTQGQMDIQMCRPYKDEIMKELRKKMGLSD